MKCAFNNGDLYQDREKYICVGCVFERYYNKSLCKSVSLCSIGSVLKRSRFQSDIFKI